MQVVIKMIVVSKLLLKLWHVLGELSVASFPRAEALLLSGLAAL